MQERDCDLTTSIDVVNISDRAGELMSSHRRPTLKQPTQGLTSFIEQPAAVFPMLAVESETHEVSALRSTSRLRRSTRFWLAKETSLVDKQSL